MCNSLSRIIAMTNHLYYQSQVLVHPHQLPHHQHHGCNLSFLCALSLNILVVLSAQDSCNFAKHFMITKQECSHVCTLLFVIFYSVCMSSSFDVWQQNCNYIQLVSNEHITYHIMSFPSKSPVAKCLC